MCGEIKGDLRLLGHVEVFGSRYTHGDLKACVVRGGSLLLNLFRLLDFLSRSFLILRKLLQMPVTNKNLDGILQMDAVIGVVPVTFMESAVFCFIRIRPGRQLLWKTDVGLFEFRISTFGQDLLPRDG